MWLLRLEKPKKFQKKCKVYQKIAEVCDKNLKSNLSPNLEKNQK